MNFEDWQPGKITSQVVENIENHTTSKQSSVQISNWRGREGFFEVLSFGRVHDFWTAIPHRHNTKTCWAVKRRWCAKEDNADGTHEPTADIAGRQHRWPNADTHTKLEGWRRQHDGDAGRADVDDLRNKLIPESNAPKFNCFFETSFITRLKIDANVHRTNICLLLPLRCWFHWFIILFIHTIFMLRCNAQSIG